MFMCYDESLTLVKENKTWDEALEYCRTLNKANSYDLATLITDDDHDFAQEKAQLATTEEVGRCLHSGVLYQLILSVCVDLPATCR